MNIFDYLRILRRGWLVLALAIVFGAVASVVYTKAATPTYTASAALVVSAAGDQSVSALVQSNEFGEKRASTYAGLAKSDAVLTRAAELTGDAPRSIAGTVSVSARSGTSIIDITASGSDATLVARRANAVAEALAVEAVQLDSPGDASAIRITQIGEAVVPTSPTTPRPRNNFVIGVIVGLALGVGALVVRHMLDTKIRGVADVPRGVRAATIASLPVSKTRGRGAKTVDVRLEAFRNLRSNILFGTAASGRIAVAGVTKAGDARSVAKQLADVLGEIGLRVVLVDVDFHRSHGGPAGEATHVDVPGVADVLHGEERAEAVVQKKVAGDVSSVSAGRVRPGSAQLLAGGKMEAFVGSLSHDYDFVVLSCPPIIERSEAVAAAAVAGSCLLVLESGVTKRPQLLYALELLEGVRAKSVSLVVDHVRLHELNENASLTVPI